MVIFTNERYFPWSFLFLCYHNEMNDYLYYICLKSYSSIVLDLQRIMEKTYSQRLKIGL